jgi:ribosomal peptide maturation radical SAM protein 1
MMGDLRTILLSLPWADYRAPSLSIGALASYAKRQGVDVEARHLHLEVAALLGLEAYDDIVLTSPATCDALCATALFPEQATRLLKFAGRGLTNPRSHMRRVEKILKRIFSDVDWSKYGLVGFTANHAQLFSSVLMAKWIKAVHPPVRIVIGGKQVAGSSGESILRQFAQIDWCIDGEGETALTELIKGMKVDKAGFEPAVPGLIFRDKGLIRRNARHILPSLKGLPDPDYDHYFELANRHPRLKDVEINSYLPMEAGRGCDFNCAFCGDCRYWGRYRMRPPDETASSIRRLSSRYQTMSIRLSDPMITPRCSDTLFPALKSHGRDYRIFCEVHAGMSKERLSKMKEAGVAHVQIGIEALSSGLLSEMNKGTRLIDNLEIMKFCQELGIKQNSHLIAGFPSETQHQIDRSAEAIHHALGYSPLWIVGFELYDDSSVYRFPKKYGVISIDDAGYFGRLIPSLKALCYKSFQMKHKKRNYTKLKKRLEEWRSLHRNSKLEGYQPLCHFDCEDFLKIVDRRGTTRTIDLEGLYRDIYIYCDSIRTKEEILKRFSNEDPKLLMEILETLVRLDVMFNEGRSWLSLSTRSSRKTRRNMPFL